MQYDIPRRRRSWGLVIGIALACGFLMVVGFCALAIGLFVAARSAEDARRRAERDMAHEQVRAMEQQIKAAQEETMNQFEVARAHSELVDAEFARSEIARTLRARELAQAGEGAAQSTDSSRAKPRAPIRVADREITLKLDQQGTIDADGKVVKLNELQEFLRDAGKGRKSQLVIVIRADKRCRFEHVAAVLAACQELGVSDVHIAALDP